MATNLKYRTTTGDAVTGDAYLKSVALHGGSAASSVEVRDGSGGSILLSLAAPIADSAVWTSGDPDGVFFGSAVHLTLAGTGAAVAVEVE